jgi:hypothetical protein
MKTSVHDDPRHAVHYELKLNTPSDTNLLRLLETHLGEENVQWGRADHGYFQMVREDRHPLDNRARRRTRRTFRVLRPRFVGQIS